MHEVMHYRTAAFQRGRNTVQQDPKRLLWAYCTMLSAEKQNEKVEEERKGAVYIMKKGRGRQRKWEKCDIPSWCVGLAGVWHVRLSGDFLPLPPICLFFCPSHYPLLLCPLLLLCLLPYSCSTLSYLYLFFCLTRINTSPHLRPIHTHTHTLADTVHLFCAYCKSVLMYSSVPAIFPTLRSRLASRGGVFITTGAGLSLVMVTQLQYSPPPFRQNLSEAFRSRSRDAFV